MRCLRATFPQAPKIFTSATDAHTFKGKLTTSSNFFFRKTHLYVRSGHSCKDVAAGNVLQLAAFFLLKQVVLEMIHVSEKGFYSSKIFRMCYVTIELAFVK